MPATNLLENDGVLDITTKIPHSEKGHLIVGEKYEMYEPAAKGTCESLGIQWDDTEGYSFTYAGVTSILGELYICTKDIHYGGKAVPDRVAAAFDKLREALGGVSPLCPTYIARKLIRPVTD